MDTHSHSHKHINVCLPCSHAEQACVLVVCARIFLLAHMFSSLLRHFSNYHLVWFCCCCPHSLLFSVRNKCLCIIIRSCACSLLFVPSILDVMIEFTLEKTLAFAYKTICFLVLVLFSHTSNSPRIKQNK